jgi:hypothetical protein
VPFFKPRFEQQRVVRSLLESHGELVFTDVDRGAGVDEIPEERS